MLDSTLVADKIAKTVMIKIREASPNSNFFLYGIEEWKFHALVKFLIEELLSDKYEIKPK